MSNSRSYHFEESASCRGPATQYPEKIAASGRASGFTVSGHGPNTTSISRDASMGALFLVGKMESFHINFTWVPNKPSISMTGLVIGNFGVAEERAVRSEIEAIKARLQAVC